MHCKDYSESSDGKVAAPGTSTPLKLRGHLILKIAVTCDSLIKLGDVQLTDFNKCKSEGIEYTPSIFINKSNRRNALEHRRNALENNRNTLEINRTTL